ALPVWRPSWQRNSSTRSRGSPLWRRRPKPKPRRGPSSARSGSTRTRGPWRGGGHSHSYTPAIPARRASTLCSAPTTDILGVLTLARAVARGRVPVDASAVVASQSPAPARASIARPGRVVLWGAASFLLSLIALQVYLFTVPTDGWRL